MTNWTRVFARPCSPISAPYWQPQEAEDLTQETFVRLIGSSSFEKAEEAQAFVFRVASNLLRDRGAFRLPGSRRFATLPLETAAGPKSSSRNWWRILIPSASLIAREDLTEVLACLDELGERTKNIFILFRLEGMRQKEIAALLRHWPIHRGKACYGCRRTAGQTIWLQMSDHAHEEFRTEDRLAQAAAWRVRLTESSAKHAGISCCGCRSGQPGGME